MKYLAKYLQPYPTSITYGSKIQLDNLCLPDEDPLEAVEILPSILSDVPVHVIVKAPQAGEYPNYIEGLALTFSFVPVVNTFLCFAFHLALDCCSLTDLLPPSVANSSCRLAQLPSSDNSDSNRSFIVGGQSIASKRTFTKNSSVSQPIGADA